MRYWPILGLDSTKSTKYPSPWNLINIRICIIPCPRKFRFWNGDRGPGYIDPRHRNAAIPAVRRWKRSCRLPSVEHMDRIAPMFAGRNANRPIGPGHVDPADFVRCYLTPGGKYDERDSIPELAEPHRIVPVRRRTEGGTIPRLGV